MAIRSVVDIVKADLPWLGVADDANIEAKRIEMTYLLQNQTGKSDADVEGEANYKALENMLFADMTAYHLAAAKAIENMEGNSSGTVSAGSGNKTLTKSKADVVEAEFTVIKASDGGRLIFNAETFMKNKLKDICDKSRALNIQNPMCYDPDSYDIIPAFVKGCDFPSDPTTSAIEDRLFNGGAV